MEDSDQFITFVLFLSLFILACTQGEETTEEDDDIDDYWSDG
jgi:hypothetical protein